MFFHNCTDPRSRNVKHYKHIDESYVFPTFELGYIGTQASGIVILQQKQI